MCEKKALFWVCCASMAERGGNVRLADQMYLQGIRKLAAPEELLRKRYQEFQQRIARQDMHEVDSIEPSRKALGTLSESELQSGLRSFAKVPLSLPPSAGTIKPSIGRDDERGCEPSKWLLLWLSTVTLSRRRIADRKVRSDRVYGALRIEPYSHA